MRKPKPRGQAIQDTLAKYPRWAKPSSHPNPGVRHVSEEASRWFQPQSSEWLPLIVPSDTPVIMEQSQVIISIIKWLLLYATEFWSGCCTLIHNWNAWIKLVSLFPGMKSQHDCWGPTPTKREGWQGVEQIPTNEAQQTTSRPPLHFLAWFHSSLLPTWVQERRYGLRTLDLLCLSPLLNSCSPTQ